MPFLVVRYEYKIFLWNFSSAKKLCCLISATDGSMAYCKKLLSPKMRIFQEGKN